MPDQRNDPPGGPVVVMAVPKPREESGVYEECEIHGCPLLWDDDWTYKECPRCFAESAKHAGCTEGPESCYFCLVKGEQND
jgi:hypothetical protein